MKVLLKFQVLAQDAAHAEQKNIRVQVDSPSTLKDVAVLGMRKAGFDTSKVEIVSAQLVSAKAGQPTTVSLDEEPIDLGVYLLTLRQRDEMSTTDGDASGDCTESSKNCTLSALDATKEVASEPPTDFSESDLRLQIRYQSARIAELENIVLQLSSLLAAANVTEKVKQLSADLQAEREKSKRLESILRGASATESNFGERPAADAKNFVSGGENCVSDSMEPVKSAGGLTAGTPSQYTPNPPAQKSAPMAPPLSKSTPVAPPLENFLAAKAAQKVVGGTSQQSAHIDTSKLGDDNKENASPFSGRSTMEKHAGSKAPSFMDELQARIKSPKADTVKRPPRTENGTNRAAASRGEDLASYLKAALAEKMKNTRQCEHASENGDEESDSHWDD